MGAIINLVVLTFSSSEKPHRLRNVCFCSHYAHSDFANRTRFICVQAFTTQKVTLMAPAWQYFSYPYLKLIKVEHPWKKNMKVGVNALAPSKKHSCCVNTKSTHNSYQKNIFTLHRRPIRAKPSYWNTQTLNQIKALSYILRKEWKQAWKHHLFWNECCFIH